MENHPLSLYDSSRQSAEDIALLLSADATLLDSAMQQALSGIQPQSWRIARAIEIAISARPQLLQQVEPRILAAFPQLPEQTLRSFLKIYKTPANAISEPAADVLLQLCFTLLEDPSIAIAVRGYSCQILIRMVKQIPEISSEFSQLLELHADQGNSSLARIARHTLKELNKQKRKKRSKYPHCEQ